MPPETLVITMRCSHNPIVATTFWERLEQARREKGWSQRELAKRAGLNPTAVSQYKTKAKSPNPESLQAFCAALGVSLFWLQYGEGDMYDKTRIPPAPPPKERKRLYKDLPGWDDVEREALRAMPQMDACLHGLRYAEVDEEPMRLTVKWVLYRADRWEQETSPEIKVAHDRAVRAENKQKAKRSDESGTHSAHKLRQG